MKVVEVRRVVDGLAAEVMNGGFDQYFFNSAGDDAAAAIQALKAIGATATATLLVDACSRFPGGMPPADELRRRTELLERVDPNVDAFEDLDAAFFRYPEDLEALINAYEARVGE